MIFFTRFSASSTAAQKLRRTRLPRSRCWVRPHASCLFENVLTRFSSWDFRTGLGLGLVYLYENVTITLTNFPAEDRHLEKGVVTILEVSRESETNLNMINDILSYPAV